LIVAGLIAWLKTAETKVTGQEPVLPSSGVTDRSEGAASPLVFGVQQPAPSRSTRNPNKQSLFTPLNFMNVILFFWPI
jgi:hypothetical protein